MKSERLNDKKLHVYQNTKDAGIRRTNYCKDV